MKDVLTVFAVAAGVGAGYLVGESGGLDVASGVVGAVALVALLVALILPGDSVRKPVSLRPSDARPASKREPRVLLPGELAKQREQERLAASGEAVAVRLRQTGDNQIAVIKVLRNYLDIGLKEAKDLSDGAKQGGAPIVTERMDPARAAEFARDIASAGGLMELEESPTRP
jgi:ribosomal protein L7/L12